jgi:hypothetical protein
MHGENIEVPGGVAKETMVAGPMAIVDIAAGEDDIRDVPAAVRQNPTVRDLHEGPKRGSREDWHKDL